ncbi:hypothetical protein JCM10207_000884 [Rhodosporidiobolus poonsookiae]
MSAATPGPSAPSTPPPDGLSSTTSTTVIPPYLLSYLSESPLPVAVYSHDSLLNPLAQSSSSSSTPPQLPAPIYQSPSLEAFLYQGAGGAALLAQQQTRERGTKISKEKEKAREKAIENARRNAPKDLSSALDSRNREPLRRWLVDGIAAFTAASTSTTAASTPSGASPHPSPFSPPYGTGALPDRRPGYAHRPSSVASSRGTFSSINYPGGGVYRQIALSLDTQINFSKTYWRALIVPAYIPPGTEGEGEDGAGGARAEEGDEQLPRGAGQGGFTVLTQLPATSIANGGMVSHSTDASDYQGTGASLTDSGVGSGSNSNSNSNSNSASGSGRRSASGSISGRGGSALGAGDRGLGGVDEADEARQDGEGDGEGDGEEEHAVEVLGDAEVSVEGARDATSMEGLAYTLWHCPIGCFRVNRDLAVVQANVKWRETCDLAPGETNDAWAARVHPDDREKVIEHYKRIAEESPNEPDEFTFRWLPEGTQDRWVVCHIQPAIINGRLEGYTGVTLNVNKYKEAETLAEARARELRNELAVLSDTTSVGLVRIDLTGHYMSANNAWYEIAHLEKGRPLDEWVHSIHPDDADWVMSEWKECLRTRTPLTIRFRWAWGEVCLVQCNLNHDDPSEATGWIGSVTNVTAQAKAEEAVLNLSKEREARAKKEAEEAEERRKVAVEEKRQQELLIDVTSHEIRNPISAILQNSDFTRSSLQSLRSTLLTLKQRDALPSELDGKLLADLDEDIEALDSITECGLAQERIANDILGLAQIQLSKYNITPVEFDLATSLRNICRMFKSECRSKGIELKLVIGSSLARLGPRARVFADPARLTQVLVNLLSNAIRFTAKSEVRQVTLAVEVSGRPPDRDTPLVPPEETEYTIDRQKPVYLFFSVEDTGPGMNEEETGRLFAKFMQASPFTHTTWGGSGLGLWIARNLCELQAGRIEVASTVGKGSIFRCFITARSVDAGLPKDHERPVAVIEGITAPNAARGAAPTVFLAKPGEQSLPLKGLTILCCEDNQINRTVLKRQLTKEGCENVLLACDGQEGLDILNGREVGEIDCILMDIEMPVMDGLAATRAIRTAEQQGRRSGHQRIIGLTGNARNAQKDAALDAGMDTVVTKPYKVPDLIEKILNSQLPTSLDLDAAVDDVTGTTAGAGAHATFIPAPPSRNEQSFALDNGVTVELITTGSPTSSVSSRLTADAQTSPSRRTSHSQGSDPPPAPPALADVAESMTRHGAGKIVPPSVANPDERLEK